MGFLDKMTEYFNRLTGGKDSSDGTGGGKKAAEPEPEPEPETTGNRASIQSPCEKQLLRELAQMVDEAPKGTSPDPVRYALLFTGEVQFVGFRYTNQMLAQEHGLAGWVENMDDGSVKMEIQGPPATVAAHFGRLHASYTRYNNRIWLETAERIDVVPDAGEFRVLNAW